MPAAGLWFYARHSRAKKLRWSFGETKIFIKAFSPDTAHQADVGVFSADLVQVIQQRSHYLFANTSPLIGGVYDQILYMQINCIVSYYPSHAYHKPIAFDTDGKQRVGKGLPDEVRLKRRPSGKLPEVIVLLDGRAAMDEGKIHRQMYG
jgi:hypothetical protein